MFSVTSLESSWVGSSDDGEAGLGEDVQADVVALADPLVMLFRDTAPGMARTSTFTVLPPSRAFIVDMSVASNVHGPAPNGRDPNAATVSHHSDTPISREHVYHFTRCNSLS